MKKDRPCGSLSELKRAVDLAPVFYGCSRLHILVGGPPEMIWTEQNFCFRQEINGFGDDEQGRIPVVIKGKA